MQICNRYFTYSAMKQYNYCAKVGEMLVKREPKWFSWGE